MLKVYDKSPAPDKSASRVYPFDTNQLSLVVIIQIEELVKLVGRWNGVGQGNGNGNTDKL